MNRVINLQLKISSYNSCSQEFRFPSNQFIDDSFHLWIDEYFKNNEILILFSINIQQSAVTKYLCQYHPSEKGRFDSESVTPERTLLFLPGSSHVFVCGKIGKKISKVQRDGAKTRSFHPFDPSPYASWFHCTLHKGSKRRGGNFQRDNSAV